MRCSPLESWQETGSAIAKETGFCACFCVLQAILSGVQQPLLCSSAHMPNVSDEGKEHPDLGTMLDMYSGGFIPQTCLLLIKFLFLTIFFFLHAGLVSFIVFTRDGSPVQQSTVIDMRGISPAVLRVGKGDPTPFEV